MKCAELGDILELSKVCTAKCARLTIAGDCWAVMRNSNGADTLVFIDSIVHIVNLTSGSSHTFLKTFSFTFSQLRAEVQANRVKIKQALKS